MFSFNFYFTDTDIMGSVADWVMVLATIVTGVFLILTFWSQQKLKKIELLRYVDSVKPYFKVEVIHPHYNYDNNVFSAEVSFLITNMNTIAKDVTIKIDSTFQVWDFFNEDAVTKAEFPATYQLVATRMFHAKFYSSNPRTGCAFLISYYDYIGNKYCQGITYTYENKIELIKPSIPVMIGDPILKV